MNGASNSGEECRPYKSDAAGSSPAWPMLEDPIAAAWLAGLLEGEGWFGWHDHRRGRYPRVALAMADRDTVDKAARIMGLGVRQKPGARDRPNRLPMWSVRATGKRAEAVMRAVLPHMGERRAERIRSLLD